MNHPIPNLAIMASAGTGKTFRLAMRYLTLLKLGVEPDEIVAMTFTNKAAGEIFDKIIQEILALTGCPDVLKQRHAQTDTVVSKPAVSFKYTYTAARAVTVKITAFLQRRGHTAIYNARLNFMKNPVKVASNRSF